MFRKHLPDFKGFKLPTKFALPVQLPSLGARAEPRVFERLAAVITTVEGLIEDAGRFDAYTHEIRAVKQLGLSFQEWWQLALPSSSSTKASDLMYINLTEPLSLGSS